jgi:uncharacterized repeat protein (TIGR01451 family)
MNIRFLRLIILTSLISLSFGAQAELEINSIAEIEERIVQEDGTEKIVRKPAELVLPGATIVYTVTAKNTGSEPADDVVLENAISEHTTYILGSNGDSIGKHAVNTTFSVNGGESYSAAGELLVQEGGTKRSALGSDYTHVRWVLNQPIVAGESIQVWFKAKLK